MRVDFFINRTGKPLTVPTERGISELFPPNAFSTNPWFSRFTGPGLLTHEVAEVPDGTPNPGQYVADLIRRGLLKSEALPKKQFQEVPHAPTISRTPLVNFTEVRGDHYKCSQGVYTCLHCREEARFVTGSRQLMSIHLQNVHGIEVSPDEMAPLAESLAEALHAVPHDEEEPKELGLEDNRHSGTITSPDLTARATPAPEAPTPMEVPESLLETKETGAKEEPETEPEPEGFECPICRKVFKTEAGLKRHHTVKHLRREEEEGG